MEYKQISCNESWGGAGEIGVKILVANNRELSKEEISDIQATAAVIHNKLVRENIAQDPKTITGIGSQREALLGCFEEPIFVEEIPNEYNSGSPFPWFIVTTKVGRIKIGWRNSVIKIDWSDSALGPGMMSLFNGEETTKDDYMIHAHGYEKAKEYIAKLMLAK